MMAHQRHLEKTKYRQWVKAGLGLTYLREGLVPFCEDIAKQQHNAILETIKQTKNISAVACDQCSWTTLRPDHAKGGNRSCMLGQRNCNCCNPAGTITCPNKVCGAIYDKIVTSHGFTPPSPYWKNTETQHWCTDPWSIAKCFINAPGYDKKALAADIDCIGLLHLIRNNQYFHNHIQCIIDQTDIFSKVIADRNEIFHSSTMQLEEKEANRYIEDMITVLQDGKELNNRQDAKDAVQKLLELKEDDFIITTKCEADVVHAAFQSVSNTIKDFENKLREQLENVPTTEDVENKLRDKLENVPTTEDVENKLREKLENVPTTEDVENKLREKLGNIPTNTDIENKLREKLENVPTTEDVENKLREKLENLPTTEDVESLGTRVTILELNMAALKEEMKELKTARSSQRHQYDYIQSKLEFQDNLISLYRQSLLQVSAIPLKPERKHCNFSEVYVRPRMTYETKDENRRPKEIEIQSMSDIFIKVGNTMKSIYVLGDAGSGKSSFCKSLVNCWCMAHSGEKTFEDEFDGIKEMKKFEFMFYIALRRFKDIANIKEMLEKQYKSKILNDILNKDSRNIIIILDGLDEWSSKTVTSNQFQTEGLPERDTSKDYTVITTSRPWKIETLGITDKEIEQRLKLKGFDRSSVKTMIDKTVPLLNESFAENKSPSACEDKLNNKAIASMKEVPIMLLQLICLWFDDKLQVSSRSAVYSGMLELFFSWNDKKKKEEEEERLFRKMREMSKDLPSIELPKYLMNSKLCKLYKYLIYGLSRLAHKALFTNEKEASLTFENSVFEELDISDEVKTSCLKLGILSEDGCPSLYASTSDSSLLSFVHKSIQEYLAAIYIAIKFKAHIGSSADLENPDFPGHCALRIKEVFSTCTTLDEILEQANVFIMLCGLEPRIATTISMYIYDIVTRDKRVLEYRRTIYDGRMHENLISNIQKCILNSIEEVQVCQTNIPSNFYVGDIIIQSKTEYDHVCNGIDKKYISPDNVRSFRVVSRKVEGYLKTVLKNLRKCRQLETVYIDAIIGSYTIDDEDIKSICRVIEDNTSTLKLLYVAFEHNDILKPMYKTIIRHLPDIKHLVTLHINGFILTQEDFTLLCTFLSDNNRLEQISIFRTYCQPSSFSLFETENGFSRDSECGLYSGFSIDSECSKQHEIDLSKHQKLLCLQYDSPVTVTDINTSNLEIFSYRALNSTNYEKVFGVLSTANKLTELELRYNTFSVSTNIVSSSKSPSYHYVTDKLITLLPLLHQLRELYLENFTFTDNIMKCSCAKCMKIIYVTEVRMSFTTWRQFVDCLPLMPLPIHVTAWGMCITLDGEECNPDIRWSSGGGGEETAAMQYVREQGALFNVDHLYENANSIDFSTKK